MTRCAGGKERAKPVGQLDGKEWEREGGVIISINVSRGDKIILKLGRVGKEKEREEKHCQLPYICLSIFLLMLIQRNFKEAP